MTRTWAREHAHLSVAVMALLSAIAALVVGVIALNHDRDADRSPSYTAQQVQADTRTLCDAYRLNLQAVSTQTSATPPAGASGENAAAANARLALFVASVNLSDALDTAPAAGATLRAAINDLATQYRTVATRYLAGDTTNAATVTAAVRQAGEAASTVQDTCAP